MVARPDGIGKVVGSSPIRSTLRLTSFAQGKPIYSEERSDEEGR